MPTSASYNQIEIFNLKAKCLTFNGEGLSRSKINIEMIQRTYIVAEPRWMTVLTVTTLILLSKLHANYLNIVVKQQKVFQFILVKYF